MLLQSSGGNMAKPRSMSYPFTFDVHCMTENYEEYQMQIVAKDYEQALKASEVLCKELGLTLLSIWEPD
jgi:hypothetical protein